MTLLHSLLIFCLTQTPQNSQNCALASLVLASGWLHTSDSDVCSAPVCESLREINHSREAITPEAIINYPLSIVNC